MWLVYHQTIGSIVCEVIIGTVSATQTMKDWKLFIIVLVITGLGLAVLLVQLIVPSFRFKPSLVVNRENPSGVNVSSFYGHLYVSHYIRFICKTPSVCVCVCKSPSPFRLTALLSLSYSTGSWYHRDLLYLAMHWRRPCKILLSDHLLHLHSHNFRHRSLCCYPSS